MTAQLHVYDFDDLTQAQKVALLTSASMEVDTGCELVSFDDLSVIQDLSGYLDASQGNVSWSDDGSVTVHRACSITLSYELAWGSALVRVYQIVTDRTLGLSARENLGVFALTTPDKPLGTYVTDDQGIQQPTFTVTGQDRLYYLNRQLEDNYFVFDFLAAGEPTTENPGGTRQKVLAAVRQAFLDASIPLATVLIDNTAAVSEIPRTLTWSKFPDPSDGGFAGALAGGDWINTGQPNTWADVINDLLSLVNYQPVWCDDSGFYRCTPAVDPATVAPLFTFDADAPDSTVTVDRLVNRKDIWSVPNVWVFVNSTVLANVWPYEGNGVYTVVNQSNGPSSIDQRNGLRFPQQIELAAATQDDLVAQGNVRVASDISSAFTVQMTSAPFPIVGHRDVFIYNDQRIDGGTAKMLATSWSIPLNGDPVSWTLASA